MRPEFEGKSLSRLSDIYEEWLVENEIEPVDALALLMFGPPMTRSQTEWLEDFCEAWNAQQEIEDGRNT